MKSVKLSDIKEGSVLIADSGFTCIGPGPIIIKSDGDGLYFECEHGRHGIDGQLNFDDQETLVGLYSS